MLTQYNLKMPHAVYGGENAMDNITAIIKARGAKKVAMFTDKGIEGAGLFALPEEAVKASGAEYYVLDELPPEPSYMAVQKLVDEFKTSGADLIVACGGGSVMDAAKLASVLVTDDYGVKELLDNPGMAQKCVPIVLIPTTAGTGSETTLAAVVTDTKTHEKYALNDPVLRPKYAVLDPELTVGLPPHITSTTGMDALTHAVEAYIGHSNTKDTSEKAEVATKLIFENLEEAYKNGKDLHAREQMLLASHYAGIAFTRAYVGNVHAIAHNLGGFYGVPHGLANAIILPYVLDFYGETAYERLARLCECAGVAKAGQTDEQKALDFIQAIRDMNARMNIPDKIEKIQEKDIETIAKRACKEANPLYPVPRIMDLDDCIAIIHRLMP